MPDFEMLAPELNRKNVTKHLLWTEYVANCGSLGKKAYCISQFNSLFSEYLSKNNISLRQEHVPGEVLELDWSGSSLGLTNLETGEVLECPLFVAAFPFSGYFYAEAFVNERIHSWTTVISNALTFFGGVPIILRPDNCKTATIKADKYEPELNTATIELAEYYNTVVIPASVRKPRDKNVVENIVGFASRQILAALRNQIFFSVEEMNKEIFARTEKLNSAPFTKKEGSRLQLFQDVEKRTLLKLPLKPFELFERKEAKVAPDYHIRFNDCFYSVNPKYIGEVVNIKASTSEVIIYSKGVEIARHIRVYGKGRIVTAVAHVPERHKEVLGWSGDQFRSSAQQIGQNTFAVIDEILKSRDFEVQAYKTCVGVLNLKKKFSAPILEKACEEARKVGIHSYKGIKAIVETLDDKDSKGLISISSNKVEEPDISSLFLTHSTKTGKGGLNNVK